MSAQKENSETDQNVKLILHKVPHYQQRYSWDCGIACVMMLLPEHSRQELIQNFDQICREEGFHQSTWTIDLCYLLKRFGIEHTMYTTMTGVNENNRKLGYYKKIFDMDRRRVESKFLEADGRGVSVVRGGVGGGALAAHVEQRPALLLLDAARLACKLCKRNKLRADLSRWFGGEYRGHYVVCVGVCGELVVYRDPARPGGTCAVSLKHLDLARQAPGTDQDLILIHRTYR